MVQHGLIAMEPSRRIRSSVKYILALIRTVSYIPFSMYKGSSGKATLNKLLHISVLYHFSPNDVQIDRALTTWTQLMHINT